MILILISLIIARVSEFQALAPTTHMRHSTPFIQHHKKTSKLRTFFNKPFDEEKQPLLEDDQLSINSTPENPILKNYGTVRSQTQQKTSKTIKRAQKKRSEEQQYESLPSPLRLKNRHNRLVHTKFFKPLKYLYFFILLNLLLLAILAVLLSAINVHDTIPLIKTISYSLIPIFVSIICLSLTFFIVYKLTKPKKIIYPQLPLDTDDITYQQEVFFKTDPVLTEEKRKQLNLHFSLLPNGSYTVIPHNNMTRFLVAKESEEFLRVFQIPSSQAENFIYIRNRLKPYFEKETILTPFSIDTHTNLKGEPIISGAGIGFELEGEIFLKFENDINYQPFIVDIPGRGPTHIPSSFKTVFNPKVSISTDISEDLELITDPIKYSIPSKRIETQTVVHHLIATWRAFEEEVTHKKQPLSHLIEKVSQKTKISYEKSQDENNIVPPDSVYFYLRRFSRKPIDKGLQCTYSIPIETFSSPLLSWFDFTKDHHKAVNRAQQLVQIDLIDTLLAHFENITVQDLKKLEGFFTILFYLLEYYKQPYSYKLQLSFQTAVHVKFHTALYVKHNIYDLFCLLPQDYQDFLTTLSQTPDNILYLSIAKHLQVRPQKTHFLANWYLYGRGQSRPLQTQRTDYSLVELLDILFHRKSEEKRIWFIDDYSLPFDRNEDDTTEENTRFLLEIRGIPYSTELVDSEVLEFANDLVEMAGYLSAYNTSYHLFESAKSARHTNFLTPQLLKSA